MYRMYRIYIVAVVLCVVLGPHDASAYPLSGSARFHGFPENVEIRREYHDLIFASRSEARSAIQTTVRQTVSGTKVRFAVMEQNGYFYLTFSNEYEGDFPLHSKGSYIIKRKVDSGDFVQAKVFIRDSEDCFVRLYPRRDRTVMDVHLFGTAVYRDVVIAFPFERTIQEPMADIMRLTADRVNWDLLVAPEDRLEDSLMRAIVHTLRDELTSLADSDDGALDADGTFRFIDDLSLNPKGGFNCSGFAKWVVDGLYYPLSETYLQISALKRKHPDARGNAWSDRYELARDPYFGLDWTRNLAVSVKRMHVGGDVDIEDADVRTVPFFLYVEDVGYPVDDIELITYLLAVTDPGHLYLGSVNHEFGTDPVLRQHTHVVVLMPYFDLSGDFRLVVLERNRETSVESLKGRYSGDFVHLVRVPIHAEFLPPSADAANNDIAVLEVP